MPSFDLSDKEDVVLPVNILDYLLPLDEIAMPQVADPPQPLPSSILEVAFRPAEVPCLDISKFDDAVLTDNRNSSRLYDLLLS